MSERRVMLTLDCVPRDPAALRGAVRLAEAMGTQLVVRFVEDEGLLNWASLPFTREVVYCSASPRAFDCAAMERSLRAAAQATRANIELLVRDAARLSFEVRRGALAAELLAALDDADIVIAHLSGPDPRGAWIAALGAQQQSAPVMAALAELARLIGPDLQVVIVGNGTQSEHEQPAAAWPLRLRRLADAGEIVALLRAGAPQPSRRPYPSGPNQSGN